MAEKRLENEQLRVLHHLTQALLRHAETGHWHYRVLSEGKVESRLNDYRQELKVEFDLNDVAEVSEVKGNLLLTFHKAVTVKAQNGEESLDTSWPLVLDWPRFPGLKAELIRCFKKER